MNNRPPPPPEHHQPGARGPVHMADLAEDLHRMNMGQQRRQGDPLFGDANEHRGEARFAAGPAGRNPPVYHAGRPQNMVGPILEQYTLTKGAPNTFTVAVRRKDPVDEVDLRAKMNKLRTKNKTGEQQLNDKVMEGSKRNQILELIEDRNQMDPDPRFEWLIGCIEMAREPRNKDAWKSMRVVLQRKPATMQRAVRHPNQQFHWREVVEVSSDRRGIGGRHNSIRGGENTYQERMRQDQNARAIQETLIRQQQLEQQFREQQVREHHFREQQAAALRQAAAGAVKSEARRNSFDHGHAGGKAGMKHNTKASGPKFKGGKHSPVIHLSDSDSGSESDSSSRSSRKFSASSGSESDFSNGDTNDTIYSSSTHNSRGKAKKSSPKGKPRRSRSVSPSSRGGSSNRGDRKGSTYIREHKRPDRDNSPLRKPKRGSIYSDSDYVEIRPGPGPRKSRHDSLHSGSSYKSWHASNGPTYGGPRHERNHSFGLNKGPGNLGFEQKERIADYHRHPDLENDRDREHEQFLKRKEREVIAEKIKIEQRANELRKEELREQERLSKEREWERGLRRDSPPRGRYGF